MTVYRSRSAWRRLRPLWAVLGVAGLVLVTLGLGRLLGMLFVEVL